MYLQRFGLRSLPFRLSPDSAFVFPSASHALALETLRTMLSGPGGIALVTGPAGVGKTTLIDRMLLEVPTSTAVARLNQGLPSAIAVLQGLLMQFGYAPFHLTRAELGSALHTFLAERDRAGEPTLVIVDEAQRLDGQALVELLQATNPYSSRLHLLLVGSGELAERMEGPAMAPVRAATRLRIALAPLRPDEVRHYLQHRLDTAGAGGKQVFDDAAMDMLARVTAGLPKHLNKLADGAMTAAYEDVRDQVRSDDVLAASRLLGTIETRQRRPSHTSSPAPSPIDDAPKTPQVTSTPAGGDSSGAPPRSLEPDGQETSTDVPPATDPSDRVPAPIAPPDHPWPVAATSDVATDTETETETKTEAETDATATADCPATASAVTAGPPQSEHLPPPDVQIPLATPASPATAEEAHVTLSARAEEAEPAPPPAPVYRVHLYHDGARLETVQVLPGDLCIGRTRDNDLQIESRYISRRHCRLLLSHSGLSIEDLGSTNGTAVNGAVVARKALADGDIVRLGVHELRIEVFVPSD